MMRVWNLYDVCLSCTSRLSREQRGLGRLKFAQRYSPRHIWLGHHFQGQKVKGQLAGGRGILWCLPQSLFDCNLTSQFYGRNAPNHTTYTRKYKKNSPLQTLPPSVEGILLPTTHPRSEPWAPRFSALEPAPVRLKSGYATEIDTILDGIGKTISRSVYIACWRAITNMYILDIFWHPNLMYNIVNYLGLLNFDYVKNRQGVRIQSNQSYTD